MNLTQYDYGIIGGDMRQIYMANKLISLGKSVICYGINDPLLDSSCQRATTLADAIYSSSNIITPIPVTKDGNNIIAIKSESDLTISQLCPLLTKNHKLFGGCLTKEMIQYCETNDIYYHDFMEQEEVILFNTIATAEGAIAEAIVGSTINLHDSSCLILGFGRCARTLAEKLNGLCAHIDIAARSPVALSAAYAASFGTVSLKELGTNLNSYNYIFNTIPSLVLSKELLEFTSENVLIIDIASAPGGVDFTAAKQLGRNAKLCLGLPGKYAPKSSAVFLVDHLLYNIGKK
jgi:dipicolinate synthase subunit A